RGARRTNTRHRRRPGGDARGPAGLPLRGRAGVRGEQRQAQGPPVRPPAERAQRANLPVRHRPRGRPLRGLTERPPTRAPRHRPGDRAGDHRVPADLLLGPPVDRAPAARLRPPDPGLRGAAAFRAPGAFGACRGAPGRLGPEEAAPRRRLLGLLALASVPAAAVGFLLQDWADEQTARPLRASVWLILTTA